MASDLTDSRPNIPFKPQRAYLQTSFNIQPDLEQAHHNGVSRRPATPVQPPLYSHVQKINQILPKLLRSVKFFTQTTWDGLLEHFGSAKLTSDSWQCSRTSDVYSAFLAYEMSCFCRVEENDAPQQAAARRKIWKARRGLEVMQRNVLDARESRLEDPPSMHDILFCWKSGSKHNVEPVPIIDPYDEVAVFERLTAHWNIVSPWYVRWCPFVGVTDVTEAKVSCPEPERH